MIVKIVTLFLIGMGVLAMFGKLRLPNVKKLGGKFLGSGKCPACGRHRIGKGTCPCGENKGKRG